MARKQRNGISPGIPIKLYADDQFVGFILGVGLIYRNEHGIVDGWNAIFWEQGDDFKLASGVGGAVSVAGIVSVGSDVSVDCAVSFGGALLASGIVTISTPPEQAVRNKMPKTIKYLQCFIRKPS